MRAYGLGLLLMGHLLAQCPYVRYILFDACPGGTDEGCNEHLLLYTPVNLNINNVAISFPVVPNGNSLDNDSPTRWVCNSGCTASWTNNATVVNNLNTNACAGTTFQYASPGTTIPAGSWVLLFAGQNTSFTPSSSNLCVGGTVYVAFSSNTTCNVGRYQNNPSNTQNRRTRIAFIGMPACSMTVNYRGSLTANDGNYLLIDPAVCIGLTEGQNGTPPSSSACYYAGGGQNGVSLGNIGTNCQLPTLGVLPVVWAEVRVEGARLVWRVEGLESHQRLYLEHQEKGESLSGWTRMASGLPSRGAYELSLAGLYRLGVEEGSGVLALSPVVEYRTEAIPRCYPNPAPGGPYLHQAEAIAQLIVYTSQGQGLHRVEGPVGREALRGLPPGVYWVELYTWDGRRFTQTIAVSP